MPIQRIQNLEVYPKLMDIPWNNEDNISAMKQFKNIFVAVFATSKHELTAESPTKNTKNRFYKSYILLGICIFSGFLLCCRFHYGLPYILRSHHQPKEDTQRNQTIWRII